MRVLFSSSWGYGHVFPLVPLAWAFLHAGHTVTWAASGDACQLVAAAGIDAVPAGLDGQQVARVEQRLRTAIAGMRPQDKASFAFPNMFGEWVTPPMVSDLLPLARQWLPDLMVHEHAELASALVGAALGVPSVTHSFGGGVPAQFLTDAGDRLSGLWADHGMATPPFAGSFLSPYLDICPTAVQIVPLDHIDARQPLRPVTYTGQPGGLAPAVLNDGDVRPLVYLTLGTVQNHAPVLSAAVAGLADLGARVLVAVGRDGDPAALGPQPDHVRVERWVNQSDVLPHCAAVVSHAGSGTFLGALSLGLPMLCLPQAADQFRNASAAVQTGAGLALDPDEADAAAINAAVRRLLLEDTFRQAAGTIADDIRAMPSPGEVVTALERLA